MIESLFQVEEVRAAELTPPVEPELAPTTPGTVLDEVMEGIETIPPG